MSFVRRQISSWAEAAKRLFPGWMLYPGLRTRWADPVHVQTLPPGRGGPEFANGALKGGQLVRFILEANCYLTQDIDLPRKAEKQRARILELKVRENSPVPLSDLIHTFRLTSRGRRSNSYKVYMIRKSALTKLETAVGAAGATLHSVTCDDQGHQIDLITPQGKANRQIVFWWGLAWVSSIGVLLGFAYLQHQRLLDRQARQDALHTQLIAYQKEAEDRQIVADEYSTKRSDIENVIALIRPDLNRQVLLQRLTEGLPDHVWVSDLRVSGSTVVLTGFTTSTTPELLALFDAAKWASPATLSGPVHTDQRTGERRFELTFSVLGFDE